ncbi:hypothetical protein H072_5941 [Dactylellina haptotyla CBS 200.50]|uniref:Transcription factor IIIC subunit 5 HTH domain-containing protein n=1 Tax=Dactylellina haptotyla (strain CBS 200.50) TaxID=1284197 RepID=S8BY50_DACHA|nr:hypothetical protein H072_5941 [Dactylellina haptotyla CBS 200.50]
MPTAPSLGGEGGGFDKPRQGPAEAPWYQIPDRQFLTVEHPVIVKNEEKAVRMLGGGKAVAKAFKPNPANLSEPNGLELRFRPGDALAPPIQGRPARTRAVLVKITVPKCKGPRPPDSSDKDGKSIPKALKDLNGKYKAEVMGWMDHTIRFRDMADYQWNTRNSAWAKNVEENLMELDLQALKRFRMTDEISAREDTEIMRPPAFTHINYPFVYGFRQNPAIKMDTDINGETILINAGARVQTQTQYGSWNSDTVPQSSLMKPPGGPRILLKCLQKLNELFEQRPIWTRRGLMNNMPSELWQQLKWAYPHVAYYWRSGPWRDTYVKFGVDPRSSEEFAKFQVAAFKVHTMKRKKTSSENTSHLFDGEKVVLDGKIWQFCDLTDPLLAELVNIDNCEPRETCDHTDGWFPNNRHSKIKWVMRRKLSNILAGKKTNDMAFEAVLKEPDSVVPGSQPVRRQIAEGDGTVKRGRDADSNAPEDMDVDVDGDILVDDGDADEDEEFESGSEEEDEGDEDDEESMASQKPAANSGRDQRLQALMQQFMQGQQHEGVGTNPRNLGADDFDILEDD